MVNGSFTIDNTIKEPVNDIKNFFPEQLKLFRNRLPNLIYDGYLFLKDKFLDMNVDKLTMDEMSICANGTFTLGYCMGESSAGILYVYVKFNDNFSLEDDVIFETY